MEGEKESKYIHGRERFLSLCFTHTSMDAPLSPAYRLVFTLIFIPARCCWTENVNSVRTEGDEKRDMREKGETDDKRWGGRQNKEG